MGVQVSQSFLINEVISSRKPDPLVRPARRRLIAFGWYGGKFSHLSWLLPLLPEDAHHYCEPFGGSAAVLLNRPPAPVETYNVADRAADAPGDIVIRHEGQVYLAFEVTERRIDQARVEATFRTKIAPASITDYLFIFAKEEPEPGAFRLAQEILTLGTEVNFVHVRDFVINGLAVGGTKARRVFRDKLKALLEDASPRIKHLWNDEVEKLIHDPKT